MNIDETTHVLKVRRDLTGESFNDGTIAAWCEALGAWPLAQVRTAVVAAAREHPRVAVSHVASQLPARAAAPALTAERCELCAGDGWRSVPPERAHDPRHCKPTEEQPCCCSGCVPCRCSEGERRRPAYASILAERARHRAARTGAEELQL